MKCIDILLDEHRLIRQFIPCLSQALDKLQMGKRPPRIFFDRVLEFLDEYVQRYHSSKEEYVLFELLAQKRSEELVTQISSLKYQHERSRNQITEMIKSLNGYEKGNDIQRVRLVENLAAYISLLKMHLHWEDSIFYPVARKDISEEDEVLILENFKKEDAKSPADILQNCDSMMAEMKVLLNETGAE